MTSNTTIYDRYGPYYTIRYTTSTNNSTYYSVAREPIKREEPPELEAGDTAALDDFLGGFKHEKK